MALDIIAIIIAIFAVIFTGIMATLSFKEQKLRLRPRVYIDRIDTVVSLDRLTFIVNIQNCGLLPAKNVRISPILKVDGKSKELQPEDVQSKAIIVPNQILKHRMKVVGQTMQNILESKVQLSACHRNAP